MPDAAIRRVPVIDIHTGGEPTRVVINGGPDLGRGPMAERLRVFRERFDPFRSAVVGQPHGSDVMIGALVCEPSDPSCAAGVIYFNNVGYLGMCGHGTIGVAVALASLGRIAFGTHQFETPVGMVAVTLEDAYYVAIGNVESYRTAKDVAIEVPGLGWVIGDVVWGGNWFFLVRDSKEVLTLANVERLTDVTWRIRQVLKAHGVRGADGAEIDHVELSGPPSRPDADSKNFSSAPAGPTTAPSCGTGTSAKVACLVADGKLRAGQVWRQESIGGPVRGLGAGHRGPNLPPHPGLGLRQRRSDAPPRPERPLRHGDPGMIGGAAPRRAVVIGGVIGAACADYFQRDGWQVTILERGSMGGGSSGGNCDLGYPSHVLPPAEFGVMTRARTGSACSVEPGRGASPPSRTAPRDDALPRETGRFTLVASQATYQKQAGAGVVSLRLSRSWKAWTMTAVVGWWAVAALGRPTVGDDPPPREPAAEATQEPASLPAIDRDFERQKAELERQRLRRLARLAARQARSEVDRTYEALFQDAIAGNLYRDAEPIAEQVIAAGTASPYATFLATAVNMIAEVDRKAYEDSLASLRRAVVAAAKQRHESGPPGGAPMPAPLPLDTRLSLLEIYFQRLVHEGQFDVARRPSS